MTSDTPRAETQFAWLIERGQSMGQVPTVWYTGEDYSEQWTTDANRALRHPSKDAAEKVIEWRSGFPIPSHGGPKGSRFGVAVEHGFLTSDTPRDSTWLPNHLHDPWCQSCVEHGKAEARRSLAEAVGKLHQYPAGQVGDVPYSRISRAAVLALIAATPEPGATE